MIRPDEPMVHIRRIRERGLPAIPGRWVHGEWERRFSWLVQGTTDGGREGDATDFALFTEEPDPGAPSRWSGLAESLGFRGIAHSRQVHGGDVLVHREASESGLALGVDADGHLTYSSGLLLGITVADCVPVFMVDPSRRAVALLHAGWRGIAAGILEEGVRALEAEAGSRAGDLQLHLGPAICGECYEVGPEVHQAVGSPVPVGPEPVDLRGALAARAVGAGIDPSSVTISSWCTLCGGSPFFSHRRGDRGRQVGYLGIREKT